MQPQNIFSPEFRGGQVPLTIIQPEDARRLDVAVGSTVMLALTPDDVHDPTEIPGYLAGYRNGEFMADMGSPPILRETDNDKYRTFSEDNTYLRADVKGSRQGAIPEIDIGSSLAPYTVVDRFIGGFVDDITQQNATAYDARQQLAKACANKILLDREHDVFGTGGLFQTSGNWDSSVRVTLGATAKWNAGSASDPIADIQTAMLASLGGLTDGFMNLKVANAFFANTAVRNHLTMHLGMRGADTVLKSFYDSADSGAFEFTVPGLFGIKFHVSVAKSKSSSAGAASLILPDNCTLIRRPPGVPTNGDDIATSYTYRRKGLSNAGWDTRQFRVEGRGPRGGTMVVVSQADIALMTGPKVGYQIFSCFQ